MQLLFSRSARTRIPHQSEARCGASRGSAKNTVGAAGIEPTASRTRTERSTDELRSVF